MKNGVGRCRADRSVPVNQPPTGEEVGCVALLHATSKQGKHGKRQNGAPPLPRLQSLTPFLQH